MGSIQSYVSPEVAISVIAVAGAVALGYVRLNPGGLASVDSAEITQAMKKGKKKKQAKEFLTDSISDVAVTLASLPPASIPRVVEFPEVIPGQFETTVKPPVQSTPLLDFTSSKPKKSKKKKGKQGAAESTTAAVASSVDEQSEPSSFNQSKPNVNRKSQASHTPTPSSSAKSIQQPSSTSIDTDGSWTRVESRRNADLAGEDNLLYTEATTSDAGITTSVTGNSSPMAERTEDESFLSNPRDFGEDRRSLAQRMLPKPRKTGVEDILESSDYPTLSRVMRIKPRADEKPASGFSWGDYEDVRMTDAGENDADGEDDGWGVVKSRRPKPERPTSSSQSQVQQPPVQEALTKRQRQNAQKRDVQKAVKATAEAERLATLKKHQQELERLRGTEQNTQRSGKAVSGGMQAKVDERGKLVWE